jgi:dTDP-4-amino-4,6-dideoxy-D-glucose ammonia-lyase
MAAPYDLACESLSNPPHPPGYKADGNEPFFRAVLAKVGVLKSPPLNDNPILANITTDALSCIPDSIDVGLKQLISARPEIWGRHIFSVLREWHLNQFPKQYDIAVRTGLSREELRTVNMLIKNKSSLHDWLINNCAHAPYLSDTIGKLFRSGALDAYWNNESAFPAQVGIYPAVTCMFNCKFCGRSAGHQYMSADAAPGTELLAQLFEEGATGDPQRFYLSGGLEPLTNPNLSSLISAGASRGFAMQLYTNGMMLTQKWINRNPEVWDLRAIRVSLYGGSEAAYRQTTGRHGAFSQVISNIKNFSLRKLERGSSLRLGINCVVLKSRLSEFSESLEVLLDMIRMNGNGDAVDFISLREDYAATADQMIVGSERQQLREILLLFEEMLKRQGMKNITVDYGYALKRLMADDDTQPLHLINDDQVFARGFPQISVVVDLLGDVYLYREAGFIGRPGAHRYVIGRLGRDGSLQDIIDNAVQGRWCPPSPRTGDALFLDAFDHTVSAFLITAEADRQFGIPVLDGPIDYGKVGI